MKKPSAVTLIRLAMVACALLLAITYLPKSSFFPRSVHGPLLHEETSSFSRIRVRGTDTQRNLLFVTDLGKEQLQSSVDFSDPGNMQVAYTRTLFASLLLRHPQKRILLIGLGGGGMVHFVEKNLPESRLEAVEIDPAVVRIASDYFDVKETERITIHTADAFDFLKQKHEPFDVIYLDAFLRPSVDREEEGKTGRLKTVALLEGMRDQLVPGGVLACNLISFRTTTPDDLAALREVFPTVKIIPVAGTGNLVVLASKETLSLSRSQWMERAAALEEGLEVELDFRGFVEAMEN